MNVTFWQYILTEHQIHTLREVGALPGVNSTIVALSVSDVARKRQGWVAPDFDNVTIIKGGVICKIVVGARMITQKRDDIHVFLTIWGSRVQFILLLYACFLRRRIALITEPYSPIACGYLDDKSGLLEVLKTKSRKVGYRIAGLLLGSSVKCIFSISRLACAQFAEAGFRAESIYPYGYFIECDKVSRSVPSIAGHQALKVVYVGTLISRKGYDIAIDAIRLARSINLNVELDLYGLANDALIRAISALDGVRYCGMIPFGQSVEIIARYDAVVVPSRYDGWSVVVNEAILAGTPLIASRYVGAGAMVEFNNLGLVYDGTAAGLADAFERVCAERALLNGWRDATEKFSAKLHPARAARYVRDCLNASFGSGERPRCPWY